MHYICTVCRCFGNCSIGTPPSFPPVLRETRKKKKIFASLMYSVYWYYIYCNSERNKNPFLPGV